MKNIAIVNNVVFPFDAQLALFFTGLLRAKGNKIVILHHLGTDKATLQIAMDDTSGLWCCGSTLNGPGANFFWPYGDSFIS